MRVGLFIIALLITAHAEAANYYVSKTGGSNANTCAQAQLVNAQGNPTNPKLTISGASGVQSCNITAGDEIRVYNGGTYDENFWLTNSGGAPNVNGIGSGTSWTNKIWIRGWPAGTRWTLRPTVANGNRPWCLAVGANRGYIEFDYVYVDGDFCGSPVATLEGAHHIRFNHCEVSGNTGVTFALVQFNEQAGGFPEITNCEVHHGGTNEGLSHAIYSSDTDALIEDNDLHDFSACGVHVYEGNGVAMPNVVVRRNRIHDNIKLAGSRRGCGILVSFSAQGALVVNNLAYNIMTSTTGQDDTQCFVFGAHGSTWINNTCHNSELCFKIDPGTINLTVRNNVCSSTPFGVRVLTGGGITFTSETNNFGVITAAGWTNTSVLLNNPGGLDFCLNSSSPARNGGATLTQATPDLFGTIRPQEANYDAGACEFIAGNTAPVVVITGPTSGDTFFTEFANMGPPFAPLSGTATDNLAVVTCTWSNSRGGGGVCTGLEAWFVPEIALQPGDNPLTVIACDASLLCGQDTLTATFAIQRYLMPRPLSRVFGGAWEWLASFGH